MPCLLAAGAAMMGSARGRIAGAAAIAVALWCLPARADETARITRVVDAQTLEVRVLDSTHRKEQVRLLGVQAPGDSFGEEAGRYLRILAEGELVDLVAEPGAPDRDEEGRLMRYASLLWSLDINAELIRTGHARARLDPSRPLSRADTYLKLEAEACRRGVGGWGGGTGWGSCTAPGPGRRAARPGQEPVVYLSRRSRRYHTADCPILKGLGMMIPRKQAASRGMKPCKVCRPGGAPPAAGAPGGDSGVR